MKAIKIEGTPTSPTIKFDPKVGKLEIKGRSVPESTLEFYRPLLETLDEYITSPVSPTQVDVYLDYFNTTSSKCLLDMFRRIKDIENKGSKVIVNWFYEKDDEDMQKVGVDYQAIVDLKFNMLEAKQM
jgi:hypothetical protein